MKEEKKIRKGKERGRKGKERERKRKGKERKGKEGKEKERKGKERKGREEKKGKGMCDAKAMQSCSRKLKRVKTLCIHDCIHIMKTKTNRTGRNPPP